MPGTNVLPTACREIALLGGGIDTAIVYASAASPRRVPMMHDNGPGADPTVRSLVRTHPAFATLSEPERAALLRHSRIRFHKRHDVVSRLGDPVSNVVLVIEGFMKMSVPLADGADVFLDIAKPGDCLRQILALHCGAQDTNIIALSACRLLLIDARQFRQTFDRHPDGLLAMLRLANDRIRRTTEQLLESRGRTAKVRLANVLLYLAALPSSRSGASGGLPFRLSQGELSCMAGMSREIVNKQLGAWRDAGWIEMSNGTVASVNVRALTEMLGGEPAGDPGIASDQRLIESSSWLDRAG